MVAEELKVILVTEFDQARKELDKLRGELDGIRRVTINWEQVGKDMKKLGKEMSIAITAPIVLAFRAIIRYAKEQEKYSEVFTKLGDALKGFADVVMEIIVPWLDKLADTIKTISDWFNNLDDGTKKTIISMAGLAASIGPFLIVGGQMVQGVSRTVDVFNALGEAVGLSGGQVALITLALAALVAGVILVIKHWDDIIGFFENVWRKVKEIFNTSIDWVVETVVSLWDRVVEIFNSSVNRIVETVIGIKDRALKALVEAFWNTYQSIKTIVEQIREWVVGKLEAIVSPIRNVADKITGIFTALKDKLVGHSIIPDMVDEVQVQMDRMNAALASTEGADALVANIDRAKEAARQMVDAIAPFSDAFGAMIMGAEDAGEAMKNAIKGAMAKILEMLALEAFARAANAFMHGNLIGAAGWTAAGTAAMVSAGVVKAMAEGGIVTRPTHALIGERGPEAVIPLDRAGNFGTVNVYVQGSVLAEEDLSRRVLTAVRRAGRGY